MEPRLELGGPGGVVRVMLDWHVFQGSACQSHLGKEKQREDSAVDDIPQKREMCLLWDSTELHRIPLLVRFLPFLVTTREAGHSEKARSVQGIPGNFPP